MKHLGNDVGANAQILLLSQVAHKATDLSYKQQYNADVGLPEKAHDQ